MNESEPREALALARTALLSGDVQTAIQAIDALLAACAEPVNLWLLMPDEANAVATFRRLRADYTMSRSERIDLELPKNATNL